MYTECMIIPPGFLLASYELRLTSFNRSAFITMGHENDSGVTDPVTLASNLLDAMAGGSSFQARLDSNVVMASCTVRVGQDGGEPLVGQDTGTLAGSLTATTLPPNCAVLVHKRTARGGRRGRGRLFIPWYADEGGVNEDGTLTSTILNPMQTALNGWRTALVAASLPPVLLHDTGLTTPGAPDLITSFTVDPVISTQRRRLGR